MAKRQAKHSAGTPALQLLSDAGVDFHVQSFESGSDHFGQQAAEALNVEAERIFKTLVIDLTAGKGAKRRLAVCCVPVTTTLSLKKAAAAHGVSKVTMADPHDAEKSSGYITGGISPLGQKHVLPTVIDETALLADTIFVSGGRRGLDVELKPQDLASLINASFADISAS
ncbi:Cys-tRNA(Pro) deacylase [Corynebacterium sp. 153RC1]|uniref:Cys-tRNA(Pro) deacylase n=1 Tax=unclassified Corynebacterium TaxID=2624378 RepID=UPI00211B7BE5|nr:MULTISPECIES: Cys-tRNA(Pro) deacylase [unclassified Corynebacterium]MCQ9371551.1 Cys-tRNA(Pro) deacylase [Corynebacterium sp. 35RC1]MCQ9352105.1 Cys-tRNA(Pro) deacylase [Corynebacterium sp. 209RC1]MCQ9354107.1 Cys-tRNA(Pro) deacylase [Corynebacterium sp. 1222RC1]MCQ9356387.1 Cys-tRNA(Pro) deacylase [Corynebacterium sp. 122RC1]MCQ9358489.1 Cys-tRNA(Pro) deacylase [Corynebacterium sp. 142RC1]